MAKSGHTIISCDNTTCNVTVEVPTDEADFVPIGWFRVQEARHSISTFDRKRGRNLVVLDFHSLSCVQGWATQVEEILAAKPVAPKPPRKRAKPKPKPEVVIVNDEKETENSDAKANN